MSNDKTGWGLVGLGNIMGNRFAPALLRSERSALVACAGRDPERSRAFAAKFGDPRVHARFEDLVADPAVQAVYLATPNSLHHAQVRAAILAGKHVLCEKPLALTLAHGEELARLAQEHGRQLRIAFQMRFESVFTRARELIRSGAIGQLRTFTITGASPGGQPTPWRTAAGEGGILTDLGVHLLDLARWVTGLEYTAVAAHAHPQDVDASPVQTISVLATLGQRCHAHVRASRELPKGGQLLVIEGSEGTISSPAWRNAPSYELRVDRADGSTTETLAPAPMFEHEIAAFEDAIAGLSTPLAETLATADDGVCNIRVSEAVLESARSGRVVAL